MTLAQDIINLINAHTKVQTAKIATLERKVRELTRQRDDARGRAREHLSYAAKYQKELAARRRSDRI